VIAGGGKKLVRIPCPKPSGSMPRITATTTTTATSEAPTRRARIGADVRPVLGELAMQLLEAGVSGRS
jgi:hypothetical protein